MIFLIKLWVVCGGAATEGSTNGAMTPKGEIARCIWIACPDTLGARVALTLLLMGVGFNFLNQMLLCCTWE